jgi:hypothetical protein
MVLPEVAAWLRAEAARLGVSPGRIIDTIAGRRAKAQRAKAQRGQK